MPTTPDNKREEMMKDVGQKINQTPFKDANAPEITPENCKFCKHAPMFCLNLNHKLEERINPFLKKTLAEFDEKFPVSRHTANVFEREELKSFIRSALNTQREAIINKIKFDETIPVMERKRFIDLISPNNKET